MAETASPIMAEPFGATDASAPTNRLLHEGPSTGGE
jgi:hypothetical protein